MAIVLLFGVWYDEATKSKRGQAKMSLRKIATELPITEVPGESSLASCAQEEKPWDSKTKVLPIRSY